MFVVVLTENRTVMYGAVGPEADLSLGLPAEIALTGARFLSSAAPGYAGGLAGLAEDGPPPGSVVIASDDVVLSGQSRPNTILVASLDAQQAWTA